jgi:hypothetical protein
MGGWFRHYKTTWKPTKLATAIYTVQWTLCSHSFRARNCISSTHNLPPYYEWEGRPHHIGPPQSLCRILPCHIMALYQKGTPYWPSSIIMPHIALPYYGIIPKGHTILVFLNHYATYCLGNMACESRVLNISLKRGQMLCLLLRRHFQQIKDLFFWSHINS